MTRVDARNPGLRTDAAFLTLLKLIVADPAMNAAQDQIIVDHYWTPMMNKTARPRALTLPFLLCLLFDKYVNNGGINTENLLAEVEAALGLSSHESLIHAGIDEPKFALSLAQHHAALMARLAVKLNAPGLTQRGQFWLGRAEMEDWNLAGEDGILVVKPGRIVVRPAH